ncbi:MAG TPA: class I SAM-dependent methyltransferase [Cyclobacteriaceae bacterium]|nr:class I SAM-dependent methyltransferase [Cyclobacteriaceae bacterium]
MNSNSEKFYDRLTFLYPVIDLFLKPQKRGLFKRINGCPRGELLEIGVGNGAHLKYYKTHDVTGIDTSESMLVRARKHQANNIQLIHMNGETLLFPNEAFDYIVLSHVIAVVDDPEKLMTEVYRVLKPNGKVFILNHFTPDNWLKYLDKVFERISRLLYFKSVFHMSALQQIQKFKLSGEFNAGMFSYFKIMIYEKNI